MMLLSGNINLTKGSLDLGQWLNNISPVLVKKQEREKEKNYFKAKSFLVKAC